MTDPREMPDREIYEELRQLEYDLLRLDQQRWPLARRHERLRSEQIRRYQEMIHRLAQERP